ncbi:hypothetical protein [Halorussus lipolyticus]|uniref:hypothetical protein n=1 Tax=Halorussus lipolyticus TaxID=3034024 RepID=UPI0023E8864C|nr:hypothetical protein [Halorussus sp. DT80]
MAENVVTADEITAHLQCPRQYEFEHERPVSPPRTSDEDIADHRRETLRQSIIAGLRKDVESSDDRVYAAFDRFDQLWRSSRLPYLTDEQAQYDEAVVKRAIEQYLSNSGHEHAENLLATDTTLGYERDDIRYETTVDAIFEQENGYLAVRYVPDLNGVVKPWSDNNVQDFRNGREFYPHQIGTLARTAIAVRGLMDEYGLDPNCKFAYISLLDDSQSVYGSDEIHFEVEYRNLTVDYLDEKKEVNDLVANRARAILDGETDPKAWQFDEITDNSCSHCPYQNACPEYFESELAFTDRSQFQSESDESSDQPPARQPPAEENR